MKIKEQIRKMKILPIIEWLGIIVLGLVIIAIIGHFAEVQEVLRMRTAQNIDLNISVYIGKTTLFALIPAMMFALICVALLVSLSKLLFNFYSKTMLYAQSLLLVFLSGIVFYFLPEYFTQTLNLKMEFWAKVSFYSLPAICLEGGLFMLFQLYIESTKIYSNREKRLIILCFVLYAIIAISTNFLVLNGVLSVQKQIMFARIMAPAVIVIAGVVLMQRKK